MKKKAIKKVAVATGAITATAATIYILNLLAMVKNMSFLVTQISRISGGMLGNFLTPKFAITTQITNPSRASAYLKGMFLDVYVEVRPEQYVLIGNINEPRINTKLEPKNNSLVTINLVLDSIALAKMITNGFGVIVAVLRSGSIPKLRFKGNLLINSIRKKIDIIYE
jgi:hypothetical protein